MMNHSLMFLAGLRLEFGRVHWTYEEGKSQHGWFKGHMTIGLFAVNITHLHPRHLKGWLWTTATPKNMRDRSVCPAVFGRKVAGWSR